eukprot:365981-Chlamydomonas_euryale.AAC.9
MPALYRPCGWARSGGPPRFRSRTLPCSFAPSPPRDPSARATNLAGIGHNRRILGIAAQRRRRTARSRARVRESLIAATAAATAAAGCAVAFFTHTSPPPHPTPPPRLPSWRACSSSKNHPPRALLKTRGSDGDDDGSGGGLVPTANAGRSRRITDNRSGLCVRRCRRWDTTICATPGAPSARPDCPAGFVLQFRPPAPRGEHNPRVVCNLRRQRLCRGASEAARCRSASAC